jgi:hypothetical protein
VCKRFCFAVRSISEKLTAWCKRRDEIEGKSKLVVVGEGYLEEKRTADFALPQRTH